MIALTLSAVAPAIADIGTQHPGGGTWTVGTEGNRFRFHVMSHYFHPTKFHSATVQFGPVVNLRKYADAGQWANSDVTGLWQGPTASYWATP